MYGYAYSYKGAIWQASHTLYPTPEERDKYMGYSQKIGNDVRPFAVEVTSNA